MIGLLHIKTYMMMLNIKLCSVQSVYVHVISYSSVSISLPFVSHVGQIFNSVLVFCMNAFFAK